jgi:hypothetical protein
LRCKVFEFLLRNRSLFLSDCVVVKKVCHCTLSAVKTTSSGVEFSQKKKIHNGGRGHFFSGDSPPCSGVRAGCKSLTFVIFYGRIRRTFEKT